MQLVATNLFYGPADPNFGVDPNVVHSAYTNNFPNAQSTQLYGIDTGLNILVTQANNAGTLGTVGPLGVDVGALGGFDISGTTGTAYAAMLPAGIVGVEVLLDQPRYRRRDFARRRRRRVDHHRHDRRPGRFPSRPRLAWPPSP